MGTKVKKFQIDNNSIDSSNIIDNTIADIDVSNTADIAQSKIANLQTDLASKIQLNGDTLTGVLTLSNSPTQPLEAATKGYLDSLVISTSSASYQYLPDLTLTDFSTSSILNLSPYQFTANNITQNNPNSSTFDINLPANYDSYITTAGTYYLYATGTSFIVSKNAPIFSNGFWINNNIDNYRAITSMARTTNGGAFIPFVKRGRINRYLSPISIAPSVKTVYGGPSASEALMLVQLNIYNSHKDYSVTSTFTLLDPNTGITLDYLITFGKVAHSAYRVVGTFDTQLLHAPTKYTAGSLQINYSYSLDRAGHLLIYQQGVIEKF